jgi:hypothetical protein
MADKESLAHQIGPSDCRLPGKAMLFRQHGH